MSEGEPHEASAHNDDHHLNTRQPAWDLAAAQDFDAVDADLERYRVEVAEALETFRLERGYEKRILETQVRNSSGAESSPTCLRHGSGRLRLPSDVPEQAQALTPREQRQLRMVRRRVDDEEVFGQVHINGCRQRAGLRNEEYVEYEGHVRAAVERDTVDEGAALVISPGEDDKDDEGVFDDEGSSLETESDTHESDMKTSRLSKTDHSLTTRRTTAKTGTISKITRLDGHSIAPTDETQRTFRSAVPIDS